MRVIDCSDKKAGDVIQFDRETIMVMCFTPKVIVFEDSESMQTFVDTWEDVITKYLEKNQEKLDPKYMLQEYSSWFTDQFCEEVCYMKAYEYDDDYVQKGRKAKLTFLSEEDALEKYKWEDKTVTHFGMLNSKDTWTNMKALKEQCKLIELMFNTEEMSMRLADDTKEMFKTILEVWKEDVELSESEDRKHFYVEVDID